jgi:predicted transcriptional regulator
MTDIHLDSHLLEQLEQLAAQSDMDVNQFLADAVRSYLRQVEQEAMQANIHAFLEQYPQLLHEFHDEYVAFHQGKLVDHDKNFQALHGRVRQRFGRQPVLLRPVTGEPERTWNFRSPHIERPAP